MRGPYAALLLLLGLLLLLLCTATSICFGLHFRNSEVRCIEEERQALLKFKRGLGDYGGLLSSWGSQEEDCCNWKGIKCSNRTDHVVKLDLRGDHSSEDPKFLYADRIPSLLGLQHLTFLDLSCNEFFILPEFIGSLTKLQYLNLSHNLFYGTIPQRFGNLSSLISLDLRLPGKLTEDHNLDWLLHLSSLKHLHMSYVNLGKVVNWPDKVNMLPSLLDLTLSDCELSMPLPPMLSNANSSSPLSFLDLSYNHLNSSVFPWLFKYTSSLVFLELSFNNLEGSIPRAFGNMVALVHLDLSSNKLDGAIPQTLENLHDLQVFGLSNNNISGEVLDLSRFPLLRELHLSHNRLNGNLTKGMGILSELQILDVSSNSLDGDVTEAHLSNLSNLNHLDFSSNSLSLKFSPAWVPPFHLDTINLGSCNLGPAFPQWLQTQKNFSWLDISNARISDTIPSWFWDLSSRTQSLNLSYNHITGTIPLQRLSAMFIGYSSMIDLSYNRLNGPLPQFYPNLLVLNLSNNLFQGSITYICERTVTMSYLDISDNLLSGELPDCWGKLLNLNFLNLANNNLSGRIPYSIWDSTRRGLESLHLQNNSFMGELPKSLKNCYSLKLLDLGENRLSGRIPTWIGTSLQNLVILRLSSNLFNGPIPLHLCHLASLQILDLSHNDIRGTIPNCLNNFTVMAYTSSLDRSWRHAYFQYLERIGDSLYVKIAIGMAKLLRK
ncbi:hypothetical protein FH972_016336 [Carpinus fangiana]|uniref:Uncharacterized protein n=1 Tax=Carpinus fangiana TaxID=176857 RepID=A0A5N6RJ35_9ROSI|nr:hypothetical protein FH972_016336 [Carpinus fangiana]